MAFLSLARGELVYHASMPVLRASLSNQTCGLKLATTYSHTSYDGHGRLKTRHNPIEENGALTAWTYNADDSIATVTDPRGATTSYTYGNPYLAEKRPLLVEIAYDPPGTQPGYTTIADVPDASFEYDDLGNRTSMTDGSGTKSYAYDSLSRLTSETKTFSGVTGNFTLSYTYQISGKLKSITDPFGDAINYTDDKTGRTTSITGSTYASVSTYASDIEYRAFGGVKEMTYGSGDSSTISYDYDDALRVSAYQATSTVLGGGYVRRATYEYFKDGNIKKVSNLVDSGFDQNYKFNNAGRLVGSVSGEKLDNDNEMETPFKQSIAYNAFGNMTERTNEIWGEEASFSASYTNGRKNSGNEIYDKAGNIVDKTTTANKYERWRFDAAGRNHETVMRWFQSIPSPNRDQTQTIAQTYDGDGLSVKRVDTDDWFSTFPTSTSGLKVETEYYVRSSVLNGQTVTKIDDEGEKIVTFVYGGSGVLAEQRVIWDTPGVYWRHEDTVTGSYSKITKSGHYGGHTDDSPTYVEYDPLGGSIPFDDPDFGFPPGGLVKFKYAADLARPEYGCMWDGAPLRCDLLGMAVRYGSSTDLNINIRTEGGYNMYSMLSGMVSTWRYDLKMTVDPEDARIPRSVHNNPDVWTRTADGRHALLLGSFYVQYLSSFAETLINPYVRQQTLSDEKRDKALDRAREIVQSNRRCAEFLAYLYNNTNSGHPRPGRIMVSGLDGQPRQPSAAFHANSFLDLFSSAVKNNRVNSSGRTVRRNRRIIYADVTNNSTVSLHKDFYSSSHDEEDSAFTVLHEATHLERGFSDQRLAEAASRYSGGTRTFPDTDAGRDQASEYYNNMIERYCRSRSLDPSNTTVIR